ncbi:hypothetical protein ACFLQW_01600 [Candidatus Zixiibacteriota bacterium]
MVCIKSGSLVCLVVYLLLLAGCVSPYKMFPGTNEHLNRMQNIALSPVVFTHDGEDQRLFGLIFSENFYDSVAATPTNRPVEFFAPESTVTLLENAGRSVIQGREITDTLEINSLTVVRQVNWDDLQMITDDVDGFLVCDLLFYRETSWGDGVADAVVDAGLKACCNVFGAMFGLKTGGATENEETDEEETNEVRMMFTLYETKSGQPVWQYLGQHSAGTPGEKRMKFTQNLIKNFRKFFPLSTGCKKK